MSSIRSVLKNFARNAELEEFLKARVSDAGYGGVDIVKTPLGSSLTVYVTRPGLVIGRRGVGIKSLTEDVEKKFELTNLQISVLEVESPELHPLIMANRLAQTVSRGTPFRRSANWTMNMIMNAGAKGVEIEVSGKLRSDRAHQEKYRAGVVPKTGETARRVVRHATLEVLLKSGLFGIKVSIAIPEIEKPEIEMIEQSKVESKEPHSTPATTSDTQSKPQVEEIAKSQAR